MRIYRPLKSLYVVPVCIALMALFEAFNAFAPSSRWMYDHASHVAYQYRWADQAQAAGVYRQRPVLIAIDENSLQAVGRWPWSRNVHAKLLKQLNQTGLTPSVVALDIVFAEPQTEGVLSVESDEDAALASAINRSTFPVVLATQLEVTGNQTRLIQPREPLSSSNARIAHIQIDTDIDGSVRRYFPFDRLFPGLELPYLGKALQSPMSAPIISNAKVNAARSSTSEQAVEDDVFLYPLPASWVHVVSYQAVLAGEVNPQQWAGVPVLVAAIAKGLGDQYVSHIHSASTVVAGGELVMGAFHTEQLLHAGLPRLMNAKSAWQWLALLVVVALVFFGLRRTASVSRQLWVVGASLLLVWGFCLTMLAMTGQWFNGTQLAFAVILTWVLWVSHTLQRLLANLLRRLQPTDEGADLSPRLSQAALVGGTLKRTGNAAVARDAIEEQLLTADALELSRKAEFKRLSEVLEILPDAAFVLNIDSLASATSLGTFRLSMQNRAARQLALRFPVMQGAVLKPLLSLDQLLADFSVDLTEQQQAQWNKSAQGLFQWQGLLALKDALTFAQGVEANAPQNQRFLIKLAHLSDSHRASSAASVVLTVVDLSVSLSLGEARDRTLSFLSHDLRAPQATILALLELEGLNSAQHKPLFSKIQFQAERTLQLAEGFVQWSQASHGATYQMIEYNLGNLMIEALDEQWASAKKKSIALSGGDPDDAVWVKLDRNLMWRVLINLISNALNACEASGLPNCEIHLSVRQEGQFGVLDIRDNGPGIPVDRQANLFQPFVQGQGLKRTGAGLGLAFVKTVLDQHHGQVRVHSPVFDTPTPHGTRFELWLPLLDDESLAADES
jgi:signal transduction histidine kinase